MVITIKFFDKKKDSKLVYWRLIQLAKIGIDNKPRVRTVVFRVCSDSSEMQLSTDNRSQKYYEINLLIMLKYVCFFIQNVNSGIEELQAWSKARITFDFGINYVLNLNLL